MDVTLFTNLDISLAELVDSNLEVTIVRIAAGGDGAVDRMDSARKSFDRSRENESCQLNQMHRDYSRYS